MPQVYQHLITPQEMGDSRVTVYAVTLLAYMNSAPLPVIGSRLFVIVDVPGEHTTVERAHALAMEECKQVFHPTTSTYWHGHQVFLSDLQYS